MSKDEMQPTTERVSPGLSARVAAVGAGALLLGVVWLGVSGRSGAPAPEASPAALASPPVAAPTPAALPGAVPPTLQPDPQCIEPHVVSCVRSVVWRGAQGEDAFAVTAWIEDRFFFGILDELDPGHLQAAIRLPYQRSSSKAEVELIQLWTRDDRRAFERVVSYELEDDWLVPGASYQVLIDRVAARPGTPDAPRPVRHGYTLRLTAEARAGQGFLIVDVVLNPVKGAARLEPLQPHIQARLMHDDRLLAVVGLGGRPEEGPLTGHVMLYERYGPTPELQLAWNSMEDDQDVLLLASMNLELRLLRRGYPEELRGEFVLDRAGDGVGELWRYRAHPVGTGMGVLMVIEAELVVATPAEGGTDRLIEITRGWRDFGRRLTDLYTWSCWSHGEVC